MEASEGMAGGCLWGRCWLPSQYGIIGDGLYNDYEEYQTVIGDDALSAAWWQVLLFIVTFSFLVLPVHRLVNQRF